MWEQLPRRENRRIARYVPIITVQKMDKKASKLGIFFAVNRLMPAQIVYRIHHHSRSDANH